MHKTFDLFAAVLVLAGCASPGVGVAGSMDRGRALAREKCAACHTIAGRAASPNPRAPAFAVVGKRYSRQGLDRELQAINDVGHYEMPTTPLSPAERDSLAVYIQRGRP